MEYNHENGRGQRCRNFAGSDPRVGGRCRSDGCCHSGITQKEAARLLGITQPRLSLLLKRKIELFSLDALVNRVARAGMQVKLTVGKAA